MPRSGLQVGEFGGFPKIWGLQTRPVHSQVVASICEQLHVLFWLRHLMIDGFCVLT